MFNKKIIAVLVIGFFILLALIINAQEKPVSLNNQNYHSQEMIIDSTIYKYMHKIASDKNLRMQMLNMMVEFCTGNKDAMMEMGNVMMKNPEMYSIMMRMMHNDEMMRYDGMMHNGMMNHSMMYDSTEIMEKQGHESHH